MLTSRFCDLMQDVTYLVNQHRTAADALFQDREGPRMSQLRRWLTPGLELSRSARACQVAALLDDPRSAAADSPAPLGLLSPTDVPVKRGDQR